MAYKIDFDNYIYMSSSVDDPMEFLNFVHEKLKSLPLPPGVDVTSILNMVHGQLEAMGFPGNVVVIFLHILSIC
jgi:hypothetical protein